MHLRLRKGAGGNSGHACAVGVVAGWDRVDGERRTEAELGFLYRVADATGDLVVNSGPMTVGCRQDGANVVESETKTDICTPRDADMGAHSEARLRAGQDAAHAHPSAQLEGVCFGRKKNETKDGEKAQTTRRPGHEGSSFSRDAGRFYPILGEAASSRCGRLE